MTPLPLEWFSRDATVVAPDLLNKVLVVGPCSGRIVEVEAYTALDPASHSFRGRTSRNSVMFGPPGRLYVYLSYGMHWCANVVTGLDGDGQAVLLRGAEPLEGVEAMIARRGRASSIADGPGKLCQAMGIDLALNGATLAPETGVWIADDGMPPPERPRVGPRVGITKGADTPWRWRT